MNAKQALAQACKRWGKTAAVRDNGPKLASTPERRAEASRQRKALLERLKSTKGDRRNWTTEEREQADTLLFAGMRYRFTVGRVSMGLFFEVKGEGDTWAEAFIAADHSDAMEEDRTRRIIAERKALKAA